MTDPMTGSPPWMIGSIRAPGRSGRSPSGGTSLSTLRARRTMRRRRAVPHVAGRDRRARGRAPRGPARDHRRARRGRPRTQRPPTLRAAPRNERGRGAHRSPGTQLPAAVQRRTQRATLTEELLRSWHPNSAGRCTRQQLDAVSAHMMNGFTLACPDEEAVGCVGGTSGRTSTQSSTCSSTPTNYASPTRSGPGGQSLLGDKRNPTAHLPGRFDQPSRTTRPRFRSSQVSRPGSSRATGAGRCRAPSARSSRP